VSQFLYFSECCYEECHYAEFRIGATYDMRTVLYEIRLFNDELVMQDRVFISKHFMRGESKTAEGQKERVCERQCIAENERWHRR
jgi:hypothetical protein